MNLCSVPRWGTKVPWRGLPTSIGWVEEYTYDRRGNLVSEDKYTRTTTGMDWQNVATYVYDETNRMVDGKNEKGEHSLYTYKGGEL